MLDRIWAQMTSFWFFLNQKHRPKFAKCPPPAIKLKVACLMSDFIKNRVLCCCKPRKIQTDNFWHIKLPIACNWFPLGGNMTVKYRKLWWARSMGIYYMILCDKQCVDLYLPQWGQGSECKGWRSVSANMANSKWKYSFILKMMCIIGQISCYRII